LAIESLKAGSDRDDVVGALREGDERGPLVVSEVPGAARLVPVGVGGADDEASDAVVGGGDIACVLEHARDRRRARTAAHRGIP
jgi:hypothetical protein